MRWWVGVVVGMALRSALATAAEAPPGDASAYAVFAADEATLRAGVRVHGNVGANTTLSIGRRARIDGLVAAPTIDLGRRASARELYCVLVIGGDGPCLPMTAPVVAPGSLGVGLVVPGREDVEVPRRGHRAPLEAGAYRRLRLGPKSELLLTGGDYLFERVSLARRATLRCVSDCRIGVRRTLRLGPRAAVESGAGVPVRVDVAGHGKRIGVKLGRRSTIAGSLWAPVTTVHVGTRARVGERVMGGRLRVGSRARIGSAPAP